MCSLHLISVGVNVLELVPVQLAACQCRIEHMRAHVESCCIIGPERLWIQKLPHTHMT